MILTMTAMAGAIGSATAMPPKSFAREALAACMAPAGSRPRVGGIDIRPVEAEVGDLPKLRITDKRSGDWMLAYYDVGSEKAAWSRAACLGAQLTLLNAVLGAGGSPQQWHAVVFTRDRRYVAPPRQTVTRWKISVEANGELGVDGHRMVEMTMPHEQVHQFQKRRGAQLTRWFEEGHAEWVSRKVKAVIAPDAARTDADAYANALNAAPSDLALGRWGGLRVKREAILRQVPPDERRRMEENPNYQPSLTGRSFEFGPNDVVGDESNMQARYEAAWRIFRDLEASKGAVAVRAWADLVMSTAGRVTDADIDRAATTSFDQSVADRLK